MGGRGKKMCPHRPRCPSGTPTWHCGTRTAIEQAVAQQRLTPFEGRRLLALYHVPVSTPSRVYAGERPVTGKTETLW